MIGYLRGKIIEKNPTSLIVDVSGVGYTVYVPITTSSAIDKENVELFIHTEVKEDGINLYGFLKKEEKELFALLREIQGVGPQTGLAILSSMSIEEFFIAIKEQNPNKFLKIPRVGKKTAERILLELKEKELPFEEKFTSGTSQYHFKDEVVIDAVNALVSLGYKYQEALKVVENLRKTHPEFKVEEIIKTALQHFSH